MDCKTLNVLGCAPTILNYLFELAEDHAGYTNFNIYKNIPVAIGDKFKALDYWTVNNFDFFDNNEYKFESNSEYVFSVSGPKSKKIVFEYFSKRIGFKKEQFVNLIGKGTYLSKSSNLNYGIQIGHLCTISSRVNIGFGVNIKCNTYIGHDCIIEDFIEINPGVAIGSYTKVGKNTLIGIGSVIRNFINIGENTIIGMGSVVVNDIPSNCLAYGNPCKVIKYL